MPLHTRAHRVHMIRICSLLVAQRGTISIHFKQIIDPHAEVETLVMDQSLDVIEPVFKHSRRTGSAKTKWDTYYVSIAATHQSFEQRAPHRSSSRTGSTLLLPVPSTRNYYLVTPLSSIARQIRSNLPTNWNTRGNRPGLICPKHFFAPHAGNVVYSLGIVCSALLVVNTSANLGISFHNRSPSTKNAANVVAFMCQSKWRHIQ